MNPMHLDWLIDRRLVEVKKDDFTWVFMFETGAGINAQTFWRLIANSSIIVTSEDHDQIFGLPEKVDAGKRVIDMIQNKRISGYSCQKPCYDLIISFESGDQLEFFNTSCGYESWQAWNGNSQIICLGGGDLAFF
jgi:hypothetical protein